MALDPQVTDLWVKGQEESLIVKSVCLDQYKTIICD